MNQYNFFNNGITWYKKYNVGDIITKNKFQTDQEYSLTDVNDALNKGIGANMYIQCTETNGKYIESFYICFEWNGKLMDCPQSLASSASNCGDTVEFSS